ncbi:MAG: serine/threonine protein kinase, partial [bacterium]|nr:serine/threonine protein kinase [bacterium]
MEDALRKDAGEQEAFVRSACGGDEGMHREVMSLLASADEMGDFIEAPWFERGPEPPDDDAVERDRIGSFKLLRSLGRGGMGVVYLAARADEEFEQQVAVKLIKRGMDSDEIISRFRHERQILAHLVHPNIARLLDGGTTEDGRPYFVMEHVDGEPIRSYCDAQGLATAERLVLFRKVCAAVQFAHQNLVVHRDLKPGNILVTAGGEPKLLDFGIAKLLTPDDAQITQQSGNRPVTPEYASPEQLRGKAVTTVSDVFSLGVLLYELLTGTQPFYRKGTEDGDSWPGSRPEPPDKPSSVVLRDRRPAEPEGSAEAVRELRRRLAGDLDHIVLKAMRHEPEKRYSSVEQLSEDIARHLEGRPVLARRGAWGYRLGKALRRHWVKLATTVVVVALIGSVSFWWVERQRVNREYSRAEAVSTFMLDILSGSNPNQSFTLREILDRSFESVSVQLQEHPTEKAVFLTAMGGAYRRTGLLDRAEQVLEESVAIRRELYGSDHRLVAKSLNSLALVRREREDFVAAEAMMREALVIMRKHIRHDDLEIGRVLGNHAGMLKELGDFEDAIDEYRQALAMMRRLFGDDDHQDIARAQNNLGSCLREVGQL